MNLSSTHAVVIGAGFGGLAAALALASQGVSVTVVEAATETGGKAGQAEHDGVTFDTGPSLLTMIEVLERLFALAGASMEEHVRLRRLSPAFRYHYPDGVTLDVHHSPEQTLSSVREALGAEAEAELARFLRYARQIWEAAAPPFVFGDAPSPRRLMSMSLTTLAGLRHIDAATTMLGGIQKHVRSPHLQTLLARYATYNGSDVRRAPATLNCIAHVELALGGYGVEGGLHEVARALTALARGAGARFRFGARVERVLTQRARVTGVRLEGGEELRADLVVSNADVQHLFSDLMPARLQDPGPPEAPSMSGWNAVIRRTRRPGTTPHTVLFPDNYMAEFEAIFDRRQVPTEPTIYLCDQAAAHGRAGWGDADPLFVMINAPAVGPGTAQADWGAVEAAVVERVVAAGLMAPDDPVVWTRTPAELAARFPGSRGSIYGAASNSMWSAFLRPSNRARRVTGLYLASGTVHPGGGVPMCMLSGMAASRAALADLGFGDLSERIAV